MSWFVLTWNPDVWKELTDDDWDSFVATGEPDLAEGSWSTGGRHGGIEVGDGLLFLRQGRERGVLAFGKATSEIYFDTHHNDPSRTAPSVDHAWTDAAALDDRIPTETLLQEVPGVPWNSLMSSGVKISDSDARRILELWAGDDPQEWEDGVALPQEEGSPLFLEGARAQVAVNRYERDRAARAECIAEHGMTCAACGFDFERRYGERGHGFIEVHHMVPLSSLSDESAVDPRRDMRPLCSNCHSMVHRGDLLSPDELRDLLR